jgi:hypothetical protein
VAIITDRVDLVKYPGHPGQRYAHRRARLCGISRRRPKRAAYSTTDPVGDGQRAVKGDEGTPSTSSSTNAAKSGMPISSLIETTLDLAVRAHIRQQGVRQSGREGLA